jgi:hypothetical protein
MYFRRNTQTICFASARGLHRGFLFLFIATKGGCLTQKYKRTRTNVWLGHELKQYGSSLEAEIDGDIASLAAGRFYEVGAFYAGKYGPRREAVEERPTPLASYSRPMC